MSGPLGLSFQITLMGMGLVFGAIILLWGLMYLLTVLTRSPEEQPAEIPQPPPAMAASPEANGLLLRVAAAAVALALAEQGASTAHPLSVSPPSPVSAWQLGMRTRQMTQKGNLYKKEKR